MAAERERGMGNRRANKIGCGSYHHEILVTQPALEQAGDKDGELLDACMDLNGVTEENTLLLKSGPAQDSGSSGQVRIVSGGTVAS